MRVIVLLGPLALNGAAIYFNAFRYWASINLIVGILMLMMVVPAVAESHANKRAILKSQQTNIFGGCLGLLFIVGTISSAALAISWIVKDLMIGGAS